MHKESRLSINACTLYYLIKIIIIIILYLNISREMIHHLTNIVKHGFSENDTTEVEDKNDSQTSEDSDGSWITPLPSKCGINSRWHEFLNQARKDQDTH